MAPHLEREQEHFASGSLPGGPTWAGREVILHRASPCSGGGKAVLQTRWHQEIRITDCVSAVIAIYAWH